MINLCNWHRRQDSALNENSSFTPWYEWTFDLVDQMILCCSSEEQILEAAQTADAYSVNYSANETITDKSNDVLCRSS